MNIKEYESLDDIDSTSRTIRISDLSSQKPRTLLYGYTCERDIWHVYLQDSEFKIVVYGFGCIIWSLRTTKLTVDDQIIPDKRLYPGACDREFCKLLIERDYHLPFTTFKAREDISFHGKLIEELEKPEGFC